MYYGHKLLFKTVIEHLIGTYPIATLKPYMYVWLQFQQLV